jgi:hypothetical protein
MPPVVGVLPRRSMARPVGVPRLSSYCSCFTGEPLTPAYWVEFSTKRQCCCVAHAPHHESLQEPYVVRLQHKWPVQDKC